MKLSLVEMAKTLVSVISTPGLVSPQFSFPTGRFSGHLRDIRGLGSGTRTIVSREGVLQSIVQDEYCRLHV